MQTHTHTHLHFGCASFISYQQQITLAVNLNFFLEPATFGRLFLHVAAGEISMDQRRLSRVQRSNDAESQIGHGSWYRPFLTVDKWVCRREKSDLSLGDSSSVKWAKWDHLGWLHRNFSWNLFTRETSRRKLTRFPFRSITFENLLRALNAKRSPKDSTDFRRFYRFPVRGQEEILYQRQIHFSKLLLTRLVFRDYHRLCSIPISYSLLFTTLRAVVCCLFHDRLHTGLKNFFRVYCFCFLHKFKITTAPYVFESLFPCSACHSARLFCLRVCGTKMFCEKCENWTSLASLVDISVVDGYHHDDVRVFIGSVISWDILSENSY